VAAVLESGIEVTEIVGTSIGALVGRRSRAAWSTSGWRAGARAAEARTSWC
jgi:hypothetical protein